MNEWLEPWRDPLFLRFPVFATLIAAFAFLLWSIPLTWLAFREPEALQKYRIQTRRPRAQELLLPSLGRFFVNNLLMLIVVSLSWPGLRALHRIHEGPMPSAWIVLAQLLFFIYLDDFLYYWMHRALHVPFLFKRIHGIHHRIRTPWAITGNYMHPVEFILTGTVALAGPLLVGAHLYTLWLWVAFRQWEAAEGHCGYDLPWTPTHWLPGGDGGVHHDWHHAKVRGNYAGFLTIWDRIFGTFSEGYDEDLSRRSKS